MNDFYYIYNSGNSFDRLKYSAKELDQDAGLEKYHFGWKDYNPTLGRWHVMDPAMQFASPYVFNGNTAINGYDADGRFGFIVAALAWAGVSTEIAVPIAVITQSIVEGATIAAAVNTGTQAVEMALGNRKKFDTVAIEDAAKIGAFTGFFSGAFEFSQEAAQLDEWASGLKRTPDYEDAIIKSIEGINKNFTNAFGALFFKNEFKFNDPSFWSDQGLNLAVAHYANIGPYTKEASEREFGKAHGVFDSAPHSKKGFAFANFLEMEFGEGAGRQLYEMNNMTLAKAGIDNFYKAAVLSSFGYAWIHNDSFFRQTIGGDASKFYRIFRQTSHLKLKELMEYMWDSKGKKGANRNIDTIMKRFNGMGF